MKAFAWLATLVCCGAAVAGPPNAFYQPHRPCALNAFNPPFHPCDYRCAQPAPDMCGPGFYSTNCCGVPYGPNYCVTPPFPPFNGARPCVNHAKFPTHPFARSPRDYFMLD